MTLAVHVQRVRLKYLCHAHVTVGNGRSLKKSKGSLDIESFWHNVMVVVCVGVGVYCVSVCLCLYSLNVSYCSTYSALQVA